MKKYETIDGEFIEGDSPTEIITALRDGSRFASNQTLDEFMTGMAERYLEWDHSVIRTDTHEHFFLDLCKNGFLTGLSDEEPTFPRLGA